MNNDCFAVVDCQVLAVKKSKKLSLTEQLLKRVPVKYVYSVCLTFFFVLDTGFASQLADRLIIEIDNTSYTQRQIEVYIVVKQALSSPQIQIPSKANWTSLVDVFRKDMVIEQEAQRLGSFGPTGRMVAKGLEIVQSKWAVASEWADRLGVNLETMQKTIIVALRIESFRRSKERQASLRSDTKQAAVWLDTLEKRSVVRYFDGSLVYRKIWSPR